MSEVGDLRKHVVISVLCIFILSPLIAWVTSQTNPNNPNFPTQNLPNASNQQLAKSIADAISPEDSSISVDIVSSIRLDKWWYIVVFKNNNTQQVTLISRYTQDSFKVVVSPNDGVSYGNISGGLGIPYDVIDKYNKVLGEYHE